MVFFLALLAQKQYWMEYEIRWISVWNKASE